MPVTGATESRSNCSLLSASLLACSKLARATFKTFVPQTFPLLQGQAGSTGWEALEQEGQAAWRNLDTVCVPILTCL